MLHAVLFLVAASEFVLADDTVEVVIDIGGYHYAILDVLAHALSVYIIVLFAVLHQPAIGLEVLEVLHSLVIDARVVLIGARLKVDFGLDDVVERTGVTLGFDACFFAVEHVVGARCHFGT